MKQAILHPLDGESNWDAAARNAISRADDHCCGRITDTELLASVQTVIVTDRHVKRTRRTVIAN